MDLRERAGIYRVIIADFPEYCDYHSDHPIESEAVLAVVINHFDLSLPGVVPHRRPHRDQPDGGRCWEVTLESLVRGHDFFERIVTTWVHGQDEQWTSLS